MGGNHAWPYWQLALRAALPEMLEVASTCTAANPVVPVGTETVDHLPDRTDVDQAVVPSPSATLPATGTDTPVIVVAVLAAAGVAVRSAMAARTPRR